MRSGSISDVNEWINDKNCKGEGKKAFNKALGIMDELWDRQKDKTDSTSIDLHLQKLVAILVRKQNVTPSPELYKKITTDKSFNKNWRKSGPIREFINKNLSRIVSK